MNYMKKIVVLMLCLLLTGSLAACSVSQSAEHREDPNYANSNEVQNIQQSGTVNDPVNVTLKYDDRYTFPDAIESVETLTVTSNKAGTDTPDTAVLKRKSALYRDVGIACGIGTARVTLKNGDIYDVTVEKAPISVFLIIGQSNSEGSTTGEFNVYNKARNQSVVCEEGQIYSTYGWSTTGHATYVAGLSSSAALRVNNAKNFVAKSLTSDQSRGGTTLEYPLNSLSAGEKGKVGFDSALAWNWHELTGEKVWMVNCGAGSTAIEVWQPDYVDEGTASTEVNHFNITVEVMKNVKETLDAEVAAGHYELKNFAYFWLQGESNKDATKDDYLAKLEALHTGLKENVTLTGGKSLDGCGMVMVRAFTTTNPSTDTQDNGPRLAQKEAIAATTGVFADVFLACKDNDLWISNQGVADYWEGEYPDSEYPYEVHAQAYENPTDIATVHNGIHYMQPGYNAIGMVCAQNACDTLRS